MIITVNEIFDIIVMSLILGVIFSNYFKRFSMETYSRLSPLETKLGFDFQSFKFAVLITAPAIILHELGHKFMAISLGLEASFHAAYFWLFFGLILSLMNFNFIFFVPAYVSISNPLNLPIIPLYSSLIAFAGPAMNLFLWLLSRYLLKNSKIKKKYIPSIYLTKQINKFLFIFNMLPIPLFDGFKVYSGLFQTIF